MTETPALDRAETGAAVSAPRAARGRRTRGSSAWPAVVLVVVVNLAIRGAWVTFVHPTPVSDFSFYFESARTLAEGGGYQMHGHPTAYWPPGWPLVLSVLFRTFGPQLWVGLAAQVLLTTGVAVLVFSLTKRITGSVRVGFVAALAWSLLPESWAWTAVLGTEPLFTLLVMAMLCAAVRLPGWWRVCVVGALLGTACLVRPTVLLFPVVLCMIGIAYRRRLVLPVVRTAVMAVVMLAVIAPWTVRNFVMLGSPTLVSNNGGINLWQGVHTDNGYWWSRDPVANPIASVKDEVERNDAAKRAFVGYLQDHPMSVVEHAPKKILGLYAKSENAWIYVARGTDWSQSDLRRLMRVSTLVYWGFMFLALTGFMKAWRRWRWPTVLLGGFLVYYTGVFAFFPAWDRFRYPMMPIFAVAVGVALCRTEGTSLPIPRT
ncbi:ArnT family glycosyltransferase [Krasilnikovia sp. MM14-A1004]|uniref:ArnT family glycosyltransferase n=1 Tax=Krasilnikovia sp. MM14-A1004 TaxID=3373541 RepID=UPI00399CB0D4